MLICVDSEWNGHARYGQILRMMFPSSQSSIAGVAMQIVVTNTSFRPTMFTQHKLSKPISGTLPVMHGTNSTKKQSIHMRITTLS